MKNQSKKIEKFDQTNLKNLRNEINVALETIAKQYGISFKVGSFTYDSAEARSKITFNTQSINSDGVIIESTPEREYFKKYYAMYGMELNDLDRVILIGTKKYKVIGLARAKRKKPVVLLDIANNRQAVSSVEYVNQFLRSKVSETVMSELAKIESSTKTK